MFYVSIFCLILVIEREGTEVNTEPSRTPKMELFEKVANSFQSLAIFAKSFILRCLTKTLIEDRRFGNDKLLQI